MTAIHRRLWASPDVPSNRSHVLSLSSSSKSRLSPSLITYFNPVSYDLRMLCIFRILFGLWILADLYARLSLPHAIDWYTDSRLNPHSALDYEDSPHNNLPHNLLFYRGSLTFQYFLFTVHFLVVISFLLGYKTRLSSILLLIFTISLHGRMEYMNGGREKIYRFLVYHLPFLPIGKLYSLDSYIKPEKVTSLRVYSVATVSLALQAAYLYLGTLACPPSFSFLLVIHVFRSLL